MRTGISVLCEAIKGTFMSEYFIRIKMLDNNWWEGAVDKEMVFDLREEPTNKEYVPGRIYAYLISFNEESAIIEVPIEDSPAGRNISVPISSIRKERIPA